MVTDVERMQVVLDNPYILMTDQKIQSIDELAGVFSLIEKSRRPLLIIAEEVAPPVIMMQLSRREKDNFKIAAIHPQEYGHWRKAMLDDITVTTGGKVISRDLGGAVERAGLEDLGSARQARISSTKTLITAGQGRPKEIQARREQVSRQFDAAPENVERDKFQERLAKLSGGTAMIRAGGATPVEQKRKAQLIEDFDQCDARRNRGRHCAGRRGRSDARCARTRRSDLEAERRRQAGGYIGAAFAELPFRLHRRQ